MPMVFMSELPVVSERWLRRTPYALAMRLLWLHLNQEASESIDFSADRLGGNSR